MPPCSIAGVDFLMSFFDGSSSRSLLGTLKSLLFGLVLDVDQHLADGEDADAQRDELDAAREFDLAAGEALLTREQVGADRGQEQPDEHRDEALEHRVARQHDHQQQREHHQRGILGRPEVHRDVGGHRRQERQPDHAEGARHERSDRRDSERLAGATLFGHLVAVDTGDDRRGFAGDVEQDRRGRPAVLGAVIDAGHHDQAGGRVEAGGERQQDRDRGRRPEARQDADERAEQTADDEPQQICRRDGGLQAVKQAVDRVHRRATARID